MFKPLRKSFDLLNMGNKAFIDMPIPGNINYYWNFGSLLGMCLVMQVVSGLFLAMHYIGSVDMAFDSVNHICRDINWGWFMRSMHANGASFFFICLYFHVGRGMYYGSYLFTPTWIVGVLILFMVMATAFVGYVLPWGQMSFWGATVITNLLSAIPYVGKMLVEWLWGGFSVGGATLTRFFTFHFLLPFVVMAMSMIHLVFLHSTGSGNPLGINSDIYKVRFHPYFSFKDLKGFLILGGSLMMLCLLNPDLLGDAENFNSSNPLVTPVHIQPEWYFLFAYAILRSIPNKLGGVVALVFSIAILLFMPFFSAGKMRGFSFYLMGKILFWSLVSVFFLLTWIGARPVEDPYILVGQILTVVYFLFFLIYPMVLKFTDYSLMKKE